MIKRIDHVQITIPRGSEDRARGFYCDVLGMREIEKPGALKDRGGLWLAVGDQQVHIGTEDEFDRLSTKAHIAYSVTDIAHWRATLRAFGIDVVDSIPIPGFERFEFRDPFGNRVEFIASSILNRENDEYDVDAVAGS